MKKEISTECAKCHRDFIALIECHDVLEYPTNLIPNYCEFCEKEMKSIDKSWIGTITTVSIPQKNVEGLEEYLKDLSICILSGENKFEAFKKHIEHNIEEKDSEFYIYKNLTEQVIKTNKLDLDVFKSSQTHFNEDQIGINFSHFTLIKEIHKTLIIGFSVLVFLMLVTWSYLTYTHFNH